MIGIIAPSSQTPRIEFQLGLDRLRSEGIRFEAHPQTRKSHWFFAGTDEERARAFFEYAHASRFEILWCARGGYGAARILPLLDALTRKHGKPPHKLLVGYSDSTALLGYVRKHWGWSAVHGPMPGLRKFCKIAQSELESTLRLMRGDAPTQPWGAPRKLKFVAGAPKTKRALQGPMTGGNLCVWTSLIGTPHQLSAHGQIVFFEEVDESLYRIDRMVHQVLASGSLDGARAVVLGNFQNCRDVTAKVLKVKPGSPRELARMLASPHPSELGPSRVPMKESALLDIFGQFGSRLGIPVAYGLPVGHGPGHSPLPFGGKYRLEPSGELKLLQWEWTGGSF